jgi:hypothetical protein
MFWNQTLGPCLPSYRRCLDQREWSLYLIFCCCGINQTGTVLELSMCCRKLFASPTTFNTWFVITLFELWCNWNVCERYIMYDQRPLNLLRFWVCMWKVQDHSRFHELLELYRLKFNDLIVKTVTIRLNLFGRFASRTTAQAAWTGSAWTLRTPARSACASGRHGQVWRERGTQSTPGRSVSLALLKILRT